MTLLFNDWSTAEILLFFVLLFAILAFINAMCNSKSQYEQFMDDREQERKMREYFKDDYKDYEVSERPHISDLN